MATEEKLINRIANSGLITINLESFYPVSEISILDIKPFLFKELILKEKDFRNFLKEIDWTSYKDQILCIYCSTDAIIPVWAYMLISTMAGPHSQEVYLGTKHDFLREFYNKELRSKDYSGYHQQRVVIKGCSDKPVPASAYATISELLQPHAQSIMYGEPCSTVPIFKRPRELKK